MKIGSKVIIAIIIIFLVFAILWIFHGGTDQSEVIIEKNVQKNKAPSLQEPIKPRVASNIPPIAISERKMKVSGGLQESSTVSEDYSNYVYDEDNPVEIIGAEEANLPLEEKSNLIKKFNNLNKYGSLSGGNITHEFKYSDEYKKELDKVGGYSNVEQQLAFKPIPLNNYIDSSLVMVGAMSSGTYTENNGFNSVLRSYDNGKGKKIEVNEMYLNPKNNMSIEVYRESINHYVAGKHPATIERLKDDKGNSIINLSWNSNNRNYMLTGSNINETDLDTLAKNIADYDISQLK